MYQDVDGNMWFGTNNGVSELSGGTWTTYTTADGLLQNHVIYVYGTTDGSMWFGTNKGISKYTI